MFDVKDFVMLICKLHYSARRPHLPPGGTSTPFSQLFPELASPHPACSLREQADLPAGRGGEIDPRVAERRGCCTPLSLTLSPAGRGALYARPRPWRRRPAP